MNDFCVVCRPRVLLAFFCQLRGRHLGLVIVEMAEFEMVGVGTVCHPTLAFALVTILLANPTQPTYPRSSSSSFPPVQLHSPWQQIVPDG